MANSWDNKFSECTRSIRPSPISEILNVVKQPGMISFAGGMPAPEVFPIDKFWEGLVSIKSDGANLMQYGTTEGDPRLRKFLAEWTAPRMGREVNINEMLLTTGSQQVLDMLGWVLLDSGDCVIMEDPTYLAAITTFGNHGANFLTVPIDADGMIVDALPDIIKKARNDGKKIKFIYTIVNFHNPAGVTMSVERRKKLAEIAAEYDVPVFEDDPYGYVRYDGEHLPSIFSFDKAGMVMYSGSFSKILSPGVRIGWVTGAPAIIGQMSVFKQTADLCSSPLTQGAAYEYCRSGYLDEHLPNIIANYRVKRDAMENCFKKYLAPRGVKWVKPQGGFFYWLDTGAVDADLLAKKALEKKVAILPGSGFCVDPVNGKHNARLNYTFSTPENTELGVQRLAEAIDEMRISAK